MEAPVQPSADLPGANEAAGEAEGLLCPRCGYDLRATTEKRCPECGEEIDRAGLGVSNFPWAHRGEIGWVWGYLKTVLLVTIDHPSIRHEGAKRQDSRSARMFEAISFALVAVVLGGLFAAAALDADGWSFLAVANPQAMNRVRSTWVEDLTVPWSAGATLYPVIPLMLGLLAAHLTSTHRRVFRIKEESSARQERARAIANYSIAPLAWLPVFLLLAVGIYFGELDRSFFALLAVVVALAGLAIRLMRGLLGKKENLWILSLTLLLATAIFIISLFMPVQSIWGGSFRLGVILSLALFIPVAAAIFRAAQWSLRVRHLGMERALLTIPYLVFLWVAGIVVLLGIIPWCIGLFWIAIDSFRR
jgi:hypothetical protein